MPAISAVDSVSAAVQRTRIFLFRPFHWGTFLKLGLVAIITEGISNNPRPSSQGGHGTPPGAIGFSPSSLTPEWIAVIVAAVLLAFVLAMLVFYLVTRLRFAFFHCLIHNTKEIRPGWRLYRSQASRFFWLNVLVGICFIVALALVAIPFAALLWRVVEATRQASHLDIGMLLALALPFIPVLLLLALAAILSDVILRDWMLPHYALDNASAGQAWAQVRARIKAEKREFFVYALLRLILPLIAAIALFFVLLLPGLGLAGVLAAVELGLHSTFAGSTGASSLVGVLLQAFFGVIAFALALLAGICLGGPLSTGIREYALTFYAGRYPRLGAFLFPAPPAPPAMQPGTD